MREVLAIGRAVGVDAKIDPEQRSTWRARSARSRPPCCRTRSRQAPRDRRPARRHARDRPQGRRAAPLHREPVRPDSRPRPTTGNTDEIAFVSFASSPRRCSPNTAVPRWTPASPTPSANRPRRHGGEYRVRARPGPDDRALHAQARQPVRVLDPARQRRGRATRTRRAPSSPSSACSRATSGRCSSTGCRASIRRRAQCTRDNSLRDKPRPCLELILEGGGKRLTQVYAERFQKRARARRQSRPGRGRCVPQSRTRNGGNTATPNASVGATRRRRASQRRTRNSPAWSSSRDAAHWT